MLKAHTNLAGTTQNQIFEITSEQSQISVNQVLWQGDSKQLSETSFHVLHENISYNVAIIKADYATKTFSIIVNGKRFEVELKDKLDLLLSQMGFDNAKNTKITELKAPMPGLLIDIKVSEGQKVQKGDTLLILEAMKMENVLKAQGEAKIKQIKGIKGTNVEKNQVLIIFE